MSFCQFNDGVPPLNSDISGIGVRISFYLQTLFLGFLSARSGSIDEIAGALYTLMATNTAIVVTGLILGLKPVPDISLQDAVVTLYLLSMSWIVVIASLASCNRLSDDTRVLQFTSVIQSYLILAFAFAVLATAPRFGMNPECNHNTVAAIFRPFSALKAGRNLGWAVVGSTCFCYTVMTIRDYTAQMQKKIQQRKESRKKDEESPPLQEQPSQINFTPPERKQQTATNVRKLQRNVTYIGQPTRLIDGNLLFILFFILIAWAFFVLNTELIIRWNQLAQQGAGISWQFGQILPMMLIILPLINVLNAFMQFGIKPTKQILTNREVRITVVYEPESENNRK